MGQQSRINLLNGLNCDGTATKSKFTQEKYRPLLDVDFDISEQCCDVMKKAPMKQYEKETGKKPILATMACESMLRENNWIKYGCNAFESNDPKSTPLAFWTEQDILEYIKKYIEIPLRDAWENANSPYRSIRKHARRFLHSVNYRRHAIAPVYGEIVETDVDGCEYTSNLLGEKIGRYKTTGCTRTGCIFCGFGCHLEKEPSRFQQLKQTHPRQYEYCIGGGDHDANGVWKPNKQGLGMGHIFEELNKIYGDGFIKY